MQTAALLLDSLRLVISRKLFWITLILSGFVAISYGSIGFTESGVSFLFGITSWENDLFTKDSPLAKDFYLSIFSDVILKDWLGWIAIILAIISTATIFPDFLTPGSIDLVLSKPIGRTKVFAVKYIGSLLFVVLQVAIFCIGVIICMGLRVQEWNWRILLAIPIITAVFSYLYVLNVLLVLVTRSAMAALLLTFLFWALLWGVQSSVFTLGAVKQQFLVTADMGEQEVVWYEGELEKLDGQIEEAGEDAAASAALANRRRQLERRLRDVRSSIPENRELGDTLDGWQKRFSHVLVMLPKTQDTKHLMNRWLLEDEGTAIAEAQARHVRDYDPEDFSVRTEYQQAEMARRITEEIVEQPPWKILGSSLVYELMLLLIAWWIFVRRDFSF